MLSVEYTNITLPTLKFYNHFFPSSLDNLPHIMCIRWTNKKNNFQLVLKNLSYPNDNDLIRILFSNVGKRSKFYHREMTIGISNFHQQFHESINEKQFGYATNQKPYAQAPHHLNQ